jgi:serine/threonine protein kinase
MDPLIADDPAEIGRYRLHARLGAGGMGRVYLAFTPGGRAVALKVMRAELGDDDDFRRRFRQEVDAARRVHGLYTAQVLDADPGAAPPWLVTAYVPGPSLQEAVIRYGPMPVDTVLILMAGVAEALQVIHAAGIVHRDLKPSNVLLAPDGPRVIDFGISRAAENTTLTQSGGRIGSPAYMAPEHVASLPVTAAADVFALGSLAAFAALGRPAFGDGPGVAVLYRVRHEPADLRGCPAPLLGIIERCLAKDPAARPAPAEVIGWCRAATAGRTRQIAQPWLPPQVASTLAERLPPSPRPDNARSDSARAASAGGRAWPTTRRLASSTRDSDRVSPAVPARRHRRRAVLIALGAAAVATVAASRGLLTPGHSAGSAPPGAGSHPPSGAARRPPAAPGAWLTGTWTGVANQPAGVVTHWTAELTFPASGREGTFRIPSLGCVGRLTVTSAATGTATVQEDLTRNPRNLCARAGLLKLTRSGVTGMKMTWREAGDASNVATAYLQAGG